ncbi:MAG: DUF1732 domain-containing protein [Chlamydiae bacterium]|nr:DUF1732 domain-containing protein [Chlamydiota bacterium]
MKSMTAYASVSFSLQDKRYRLEIQSLNKKGLEIQLDLPSSFFNLNIPLRLFLSSKLERGTIFVRIKEELADRQSLNIKELKNLKALEIPHHDEERFLKEVIYYVEKQDVTEEITRLKSHIHQMKTLCNTDQAIGRKLEFLTQECFRELNTLCAKTAQLESINLTLVLKAEFEKIKEQIMNIE